MSIHWMNIKILKMYVFALVVILFDQEYIHHDEDSNHSDLGYDRSSSSLSKAISD